MQDGIQLPMRIWFAVTLCLLCGGCASRIEKSTVLFEYADFGPQAMAYPLLGPKNLQWEPEVPILIGQGKVHVVVYKGIPVETVQKQFPADRSRNLDYRYLQYGEALNYLDAKIERNLLRRVTARLRRTRDKLIAVLG